MLGCEVIGEGVMHPVNGATVMRQCRFKFIEHRKIGVIVREKLELSMKINRESEDGYGPRLEIFSEIKCGQTKFTCEIWKRRVLNL